MKLNNNEKNVIIVFDSSIDLILSVSKCSDDNFLIFHSHNPEEFGLAVKKFNDNISIIIAKDECESYDTLDVLEQYKNNPWFENASSLVIAGQKNIQREQRALKIGIKDYIGGTSDTDIMVSHELKLMIEIQKLKSLSNRDGLTGFYNQSAAKDIVFKTLHNNINQEFLFAIIDLDYFKQVNDVKGHQFGDLVLKKESKHIKELLNDKSVAIRYGGDEFIFVTPLSGNIEDMAQSVYDKTHFVLSDYQITNSIGISTTLSGKREFKSLFQMADKALYNAKANGRNQYCIYTDDLSEKLDGAEEELRNEVLNLDTSSLIHSLINNYEKVYHLDLNKIAVTKLCKKANGDYGWSSPIEYIPYINSLLQNVEEKEKLRFSDFNNPNTLSGRLKDGNSLIYCYKGTDDIKYKIEYLAGDKDIHGKVINTLMLLSKIKENDIIETDTVDHSTAIEKCLYSSLISSYNSIWIIHPESLSRELVSIKTDISRHRRINRLFEGGNYWEDTQGYINLYVEEKKEMFRLLHPDVINREIEENGRYNVKFHRTIDGTKYLCEYDFLKALYKEEKVIVQLYRRLQKTD